MVSEQSQTQMDEEVIEDDDIRQAVEAWVKAKEKVSALKARIKELAADVKRDTVRTLLVVDEEPHLYRIAGTPYVIEVKRPGEPRDVEFTTPPKGRMSLSEDEEEPEGVQGEMDG